MTPPPRTHLPPRLLPVLYFGAAHVALALAFGAVAVDPRGVSGFFYHARILGIVHLITLGWITTSILGSLYIIGPIALRTWIPATWLDYIAFVMVLIGIVGMVAHFWIQDYAGMAWSAVTVGFGIIAVGVHVIRCLDTLVISAPSRYVAISNSKITKTASGISRCSRTLCRSAFQRNRSISAGSPEALSADEARRAYAGHAASGNTGVGCEYQESE